MAARTAVYLDYNATTPLDPRVLEAMRPFLGNAFGNAGSGHVFGRRAAEAVERARERVARLIGAKVEEIVFTSGATESNNLAIKGVAEAYAEKGRHIITGLTEHKAVLEVCQHLARHGFEVSWLAPDGQGLVSAEQVTDAIRNDTILVTLMAANNETGTLHPVAEIGRVARERGVIFHSDATQAVGKVTVDVAEAGVDLLSLSAHKFCGPQGVGVLYVRRGPPRLRLEPQTHGGGQERGLRSGTLNVAGIVGLGAAAEIARAELLPEAARVGGLRDRLEATLVAGLEGIELNGHPTERLANTLNVSFAYVEAEQLLARLPDVAVSSGAACTSAVLQPSHVLKAMGVPEDRSYGSIRFSLGRFTTGKEVDYAASRVIQMVNELREANPVFRTRGGCRCSDGKCCG
jgi:cysteine desulfurase